VQVQAIDRKWSILKQGRTHLLAKVQKYTIVLSQKRNIRNTKDNPSTVKFAVNVSTLGVRKATDL